MGVIGGRQDGEYWVHCGVVGTVHWEVKCCTVRWYSALGSVVQLYSAVHQGPREGGRGRVNCLGPGMLHYISEV